MVVLEGKDVLHRVRMEGRNCHWGVEGEMSGEFVQGEHLISQTVVMPLTVRITWRSVPPPAVCIFVCYNTVSLFILHLTGNPFIHIKANEISGSCFHPHTCYQFIVESNQLCPLRSHSKSRTNFRRVWSSRRALYVLPSVAVISATERELLTDWTAFVCVCLVYCLSVCLSVVKLYISNTQTTALGSSVV